MCLHRSVNDAFTNYQTINRPAGASLWLVPKRMFVYEQDICGSYKKTIVIYKRIKWLAGSVFQFGTHFLQPFFHLPELFNLSIHFGNLFLEQYL